MSTPAAATYPAKANCGMPGVAAQFSLPGSARARFCNSARELMLSEADAAMAINESDAETIGTTSNSGS